jgi:hypothetical protein
VDMARNGKGDVRARSEAAERYRLAAEEALNQLDLHCLRTFLTD